MTSWWLGQAQVAKSRRRIFVSRGKRKRLYWTWQSASIGCSCCAMASFSLAPQVERKRENNCWLKTIYLNYWLDSMQRRKICIWRRQIKNWGIVKGLRLAALTFPHPELRQILVRVKFIKRLALLWLCRRWDWWPVEWHQSNSSWATNQDGLYLSPINDTLKVGRQPGCWILKWKQKEGTKLVVDSMTKGYVEGSWESEDTNDSCNWPPPTLSTHTSIDGHCDLMSATHWQRIYAFNAIRSSL